ncbi:MAG: hypothetical protein ACLRT4_12585 [Thomasclavelia sp.]
MFKENQYRQIVNMIGEEIIQSGNEGYYIMRDKNGKDTSNGVIGHAWLLEGIIYIFKVTHDEKYLNLCKKIIDLHEFDNTIGVWFCPNSTVYDKTLNHQLWFASILSEVNTYLSNSKYENQINSFLNHLEKNMIISKEGRISHYVNNGNQLKDVIKINIKNCLLKIREYLNLPSMKYKENGYHLFNFVALAKLNYFYNDHPFFKTVKYRKSLKYCYSKKLYDELISQHFELDISIKNKDLDRKQRSMNIYGYPYNVPGFEIMYLHSFQNNRDNIEDALRILDKQFELTYDESIKMFGKNCFDNITINYRIYEYYRYIEREIYNESKA